MRRSALLSDQGQGLVHLTVVGDECCVTLPGGGQPQLNPVSSHFQAPTAPHVKDLRRLARYFAGTLDWELTLLSQEQRIRIDAHTDS